MQALNFFININGESNPEISLEKLYQRAIRLEEDFLQIINLC